MGKRVMRAIKKFDAGGTYFWRGRVRSYRVELVGELSAEAEVKLRALLKRH